MKRKHLPKKLREEKENLQTNEVEIFCQKKKPTDKEKRGQQPTDKEEESKNTY